jgi:hypothetical protein
MALKIAKIEKDKKPSFVNGGGGLINSVLSFQPQSDTLVIL